MSAAALFHAARRRDGFHGHERAVCRHAVAEIAARGRRAFWRGNLLRESGHDFAGAPITLAAQNGIQRRRGIKKGATVLTRLFALLFLWASDLRIDSVV